MGAGPDVRPGPALQLAHHGGAPVLELSSAEYKATQDRVELLCRLVLETDPEALAAFIAQAETADTVGAFMDPTLWMRGHERLQTVITHARGIARLRRTVADTVAVAQHV